MSTTAFKLAGTWEEVKEKLKEVNLDLTDEDLEYQPGQEEILLERLSSKLGKNKEETRALIESVSYNSGIAS
jgi:uncharacterized protein YjbJ (UPF0337 family)